MNGINTVEHTFFN